MERNLKPVATELLPYIKQHALHIPEIVGMIVSHLTSTEILFCRGVSKDWCRIFSPFLKLHAIYSDHGAFYKARFEERLETLGPYVQSFKQVYPARDDLDKIKQTCPNLKRIDFFLRDKSLPDTQAMVKFFQAMRSLERVGVVSHNDLLMTSCLVSLASYQISPDSESTLPAVASGQTISAQHPPCDPLRVLEVGIAARSVAFPTIEWDLLEAVLTRHQLIQDLTIRQAHLREASDFTNSGGIRWARSASITFGQQAQQKWGVMSSELKEQNEGANRMEYLSSILGIAAPESTVFNYLETLVFDNVKISEELFVSVVSRCPSLKTLNIKLTGVEMPMHAWSSCLPCCPQLTNIIVNNEHGGVCVDIPDVWTLAPTLRTLHVTRSRGPDVYFSDVESYLGLENTVWSPTPHPGHALVSLELRCGISITDTRVRSVMSHCRFLERLVLELLYFTERMQGAEQSIPFPEWSCRRSLKSLELQTIYRGGDRQFDVRTHLFMNRLKDLEVLEKLILPGKLLSDLSESGVELYGAFRDFLARLDIWNHQYFARAQRQSVIPTSDANQEATDLQHQQPSQELGYRHAEQCHVWARDGSGPINFIPQMPSVKNVTLTSPSDTRFALEMRHLHILMEALPGVRTIWTSKNLYGMDCIPRFKYFYNCFQEFYGLTGVELILESP
ncbi:hypothetical protein BGX21_001380 [Mortierella sp. AD011]|nr:hypothetical protein BGX21_001380 [Mortierella sp. AD011]